jgi:hypothetical protein
MVREFVRKFEGGCVVFRDGATYALADHKFMDELIASGAAFDPDAPPPPPAPEPEPVAEIEDAHAAEGEAL